MKRICDRTGKRLLMVMISVIIPILTFAQDPGEPCDDSDPLDNNCPLDSWYYIAIVIIVAIVFVGIHLRKQAIIDYEKAQALA